MKRSQRLAEIKARWAERFSVPSESPDLSDFGQALEDIVWLLDYIATLENARLREFVTDLADFGTRHDCNPTLMYSNEHELALFCYDYIRGMDSSIRERAKVALEEATP